MARVYKATVYVIDYDGNDFGDEEKFVSELEFLSEGNRYFSFNKISDVEKSKEFEWDDDIDLNYINATKDTYEKYFK